jgi:hypothetical protein
MADLRIYPYQIVCEMRYQALTLRRTHTQTLTHTRTRIRTIYYGILVEHTPTRAYTLELTPDVTSGFTLPDLT